MPTNSGDSHDVECCIETFSFKIRALEITRKGVPVIIYSNYDQPSSAASYSNS